jgi:hypothetical protein
VGGWDGGAVTSLNGRSVHTTTCTYQLGSRSNQELQLRVSSTSQLSGYQPAACRDILLGFIPAILFYTPPSPTHTGRFIVGCATSPDGFRWTRRGPVFDTRAAGAKAGDHDELGAGARHVVGGVVAARDDPIPQVHEGGRGWVVDTKRLLPGQGSCPVCACS